MSEPHPNPSASQGPGTPPGLGDSAKRIGVTGKATVESAVATGRALRHLVAADLALAQAALVRIVVFTVVAALFGAATWLLVIVCAILALHALGLSLLAASLIGTIVSLIVTAIAGWRISVYAKDTTLSHTRTQLQRFGLFLPGDDEQPPAASGPETGHTA